MITRLIRGQGHSTFSAPSQFVNALVNIVQWYSMKFRPLGRRLSCVPNSNFEASSGILTLFFLCSPSQIALFIMTIVINPVQRMFRRRFKSHIIEKVLERIETKFDSTTAIMDKCRICRILTSIFSVRKRAVFGSPVSTLAIAVRKMSGFAAFSSQAPTRFCMPTYQIFGRHNSLVATFAFTEPSGFSNIMACG